MLFDSQTTRGTYIGGLLYKDSRSILSRGDLVGFGCKTKNKHLKDPQDRKHFVYRIAIGNELDSCGTIDLCDDSDEENNDNGENHSVLNGSLNDSHETDDEHDSSDEVDVKPDIHTLMRTAYQERKIKEEIGWNSYDYEKTMNNGNDKNETNGIISQVSSDEVLELSSDEECIVNDPPQKRQRHAKPEYLFETQEETANENNDDHINDDSHMKNASFDSTDDQTDVASEYQMSDAILKEKVKNAPRSRAQQLARDFLISQNARTNHNNQTVAPKQGAKSTKTPKTETTRRNSQEPSTSNFVSRSNNITMSIEDLKNQFITELTKWEFQWIAERKLNPLQLMKNIRTLDIDFQDLATFQGFDI